MDVKEIKTIQQGKTAMEGIVFFLLCNQVALAQNPQKPSPDGSHHGNTVDVILKEQPCRLGNVGIR